MKAVLLDQATLGNVSLAPLFAVLKSLKTFDFSTPDEILERAKDAEIILTNKCILDKNVLEKLEKLKFIQVLATGTNNVDLEYAKKAQITVKNVTGYSSKSVATYVITSIFNLLTSFPSYTKYVDDGRWQDCREFCYLGFPIESIEGKTLGIFGYGDIAKNVESMVKLLGMKTVIAQGHSKNPSNERESLQTVLSVADILLISCPLTDETKNAITMKELSLMKPSSSIIIASRGGIVNEDDLAHALVKGLISGAAIDVLTTEPPRNNPLLSIRHDRLYITPHTAWASIKSREALINIAADNCKLFR